MTCFEQLNWLDVETPLYFVLLCTYIVSRGWRRIHFTSFCELRMVTILNNGMDQTDYIWQPFYSCSLYMLLAPT